LIQVTRRFLAGAAIAVIGSTFALPGVATAQETQPDSAYAATGIGSEVASFAQSFADRALNSAQELAIQAMALVGIRYTFGGRSPDTGFDCSGLVRYVFNRVTGRSLPHNSFDMAKLGMTVAKGELQPGDLVFYNTRGRSYSHVGIYVGEGRFIHAPSRGGRVHIVDMRHSYWLSRFDGARRLAG
jgi:cell wall-associated NlpC family hydrolase